MDSNKKKAKMNLLNRIKEKALNNEKNKEEDNILNDNNNILLKTILNKKMKKMKNGSDFPLIKTLKSENKSDIDIKPLTNKKMDKNNKLFLSHENIYNLTKSKSHSKV